ncbi:HNH endonuclease [Acerihabitans arboris]|uniref:HNH domain-containing protein n=1 Tax=Acerihabitans arboris TaxID=2691583 RepID=A0A845SGX0_9GAMM|nr:HNH endonuclease [Acerihabitans arboris]NDL62567.1 hypothetical protein [Acerihabitans arboris]
MRPLNKRSFTARKAEYKPYGSAKTDLMRAIGAYCSYCERHSYSCGIDVEHIRHKSQYIERMNLWSNFLLACKNCNSVKGVNAVKDMYFPTVSDTFRIFAYHWDGRVDINRAALACPAAREKARSLIRLVGLDRRPGHPDYSPRDKRWSDRRAIWALAERYLTPWRAGVLDALVIVDLAKLSGGWSIWMTVFKDEKRVLDKLIVDFPCTRLEYFSLA